VANGNGVRIDWKITPGHILAAVIFLVSAGSVWSGKVNLSMENIAAITKQLDKHADLPSHGATAERLARIEANMANLNATLARIERRLESDSRAGLATP